MAKIDWSDKMRVYITFIAIAVVIAGAYLDLAWLSALALAVGGLSAISRTQKRSALCDSRKNPPTVFRK